MVKIRKAKKEDLVKIAEIFREEYSKPPYNGNWNKKNSLTAIKEHFKKYFIYVLEEKGEIRGFAVIEEFTSSGKLTCFIDEIVIDAAFQGKGFGKNIMEFIERYCKKKKIKKIGLSANRKAKAFKFYKKLGYKEAPSVNMEKTLK